MRVVFVEARCGWSVERGGLGGTGLSGIGGAGRAVLGSRRGHGEARMVEGKGCVVLRRPVGDGLGRAVDGGARAVELGRAG